MKRQIKKKVSRPSSITAICIINWILSAIYILIGMMVVAVLIYIPELLTQLMISFGPIQSDFIGLVIGILAWLFFLSVFTIVAFYYVWRMRARGWYLGVIALLILIFTNLPSLSISLLLVVLYIVMLIILWKKRYAFVK